MAVLTGTHDISDLLATRFPTTITDVGMEVINEIISKDLAAHNALVNEMVANMVEFTTQKLRAYGGSVGGEMVEVDEYGLAPTQKVRAGATAGFPLRLFQYNVGWTYKWMQNHAPSELATMVLAAEQAHMRKIEYEIKRAIFLSANYTFNDHLVDKVDIAVKRLINADSSSIPNGPNGEVFDGATHTHYNANATLTAGAVTACINDVIEHGYGGDVKLAISTTDEAAFRLLTGFVAYVDPRIVYRVTDTPGQTLDISRLDNRAIGIFGGAEVWVKSWIPANYLLVWDALAADKPLAFRQRDAQGLQGLRIAAENEDYPLYAKDMEAEFGIGVWGRLSAAALYFASGTWTDPTITLM